MDKIMVWNPTPEAVTDHWRTEGGGGLGGLQPPQPPIT